MSMFSIGAEAGLPAPKKSRRGRRSRGKGPKSQQAATVHASIPAAAVAHHAALGDAMANGDAPVAKSSALMLANALHAMAKKSAAPVSQDPQTGNDLDDEAGM